jgi:hypothetical protein
MDIQPRSSHEQHVDLLRGVQAKQLDKHVRQLENHLHSHWFDNARTKKLLKKVQKDIGEVAIGKQSRLQAVGYTYDASGYIDPTPIMIDSDEAHFNGVAIHSVDGVDRVLCDYEIHDVGDDAKMWPYSIPPAAILRAEVDISQRHQAFDWIANGRTFAAKMFQSTDFFHLNPEQQHMLLRKKVADEMVADFSIEYDEETPVSIGCRRYYQLAYGDTSPIDWRERSHEDGILEGTIIHVVYLESLHSHQPHIVNKEAFNYGRGLPCLVVANDEQETISFIPAADITAFSSSIDANE